MFDKLRRSLTGKPAPAKLPAQPRPGRPLPIDVTDADFAAVVEAAEGLAIVDFWAEWCEPCKIMSAYVSFLAADYAGRAVITAMDTDENPATPARCNVMGLPTLLFLRDCVEIDRIVGVEGYDSIRQRVEIHLSK